MFPPKPGGRWSKFDLHILFTGLFNHQLDTVFFVRNCWFSMSNWSLQSPDKQQFDGKSFKCQGMLSGHVHFPGWFLCRNVTGLQICLPSLSILLLGKEANPPQNCLISWGLGYVTTTFASQSWSCRSFYFWKLRRFGPKVATLRLIFSRFEFGGAKILFPPSPQNSSSQIGSGWIPSYMTANILVYIRWLFSLKRGVTQKKSRWKNGFLKNGRRWPFLQHSVVLFHKSVGVAESLWRSEPNHWDRCSRGATGGCPWMVRPRINGLFHPYKGRLDTSRK